MVAPFLSKILICILSVVFITEMAKCVPVAAKCARGFELMVKLNVHFNYNDNDNNNNNNNVLSH